jgi:hypothetical protein
MNRLDEIRQCLKYVEEHGGTRTREVKNLVCADVAWLLEQLAAVTAERDESQGANILNRNALRLAKERLALAEKAIEAARPLARLGTINDDGPRFRDALNAYDHAYPVDNESLKWRASGCVL